MLSTRANARSAVAVVVVIVLGLVSLGAGSGDSTKALLAKVNDASDPGSAKAAHRRCRAAGELAERGERAVVEPLVAWVNAAVSAVPAIDEKSGGVLLPEDPAVVLAGCAARHLGALRAPQAVDPLLAALPSVCDRAKALGFHPGGGGTFNHHFDEDAIKALTRIKDVRAIPPILEFLTRGPADCDASVFLEYDEVAERAGLLVPFGKPAVASLTSALGDPRCVVGCVEQLAASALGGIGGPAAQRALLAHLESGRASPGAASELHRFYDGHLGELLPYLQSPQTVHVYAALIDGMAGSFGKKDVPFREIDDALVAALSSFGDVDMAAGFVNSDRPALQDAGRAWADANGYTILPVSTA